MSAMANGSQIFDPVSLAERERAHFRALHAGSYIIATVMCHQMQAPSGLNTTTILFH